MVIATVTFSPVAVVTDEHLQALRNRRGSWDERVFKALGVKPSTPWRDRVIGRPMPQELADLLAERLRNRG